MNSQFSENQILESKGELRPFFISIILAFTFAAFLRRFTELGIIKSASVASWSVCMAVFLPPAGLLIYRLKCPLRWFGITGVGLFKSIRNAFILCIIFSVLLTVFPDITSILGSNEISNLSLSSFCSLNRMLQCS